MRARLTVALVLALVASACRAAAPATPTSIVLATGFVPSVNFAPYYLAQDRGYYTAEGLNVDIRHGQNADLLSQVGAGAVDFAVSGGDALEPARVAGVPVTYVMGQFTKYPVGALALADGPPLASPGDLRGRTIGVSAPNGSTYIALRALLRAAQLQESDVTVISIGFTELEALTQKRIDVAMTFLTNEPVQARAMDIPVKTLEVSPYADLVSTGLATSDSTVRDRPELVQRFVRASLHGLRDALADPDAAFAASLERMPELAGSPQQAIQRQVLDATLAFEQPVAGHPLGWTDPAAWQSTQDLLLSAGLIPRTIDPNSYFTNRFVEQPGT